MNLPAEAAPIIKTQFTGRSGPGDQTAERFLPRGPGVKICKAPGPVAFLLSPLCASSFQRSPRKTLLPPGLLILSAIPQPRCVKNSQL